MSLPDVDEARARMLACVAPLPAETVNCEEAGGRVLRQDIHATRDQPPADVSAMDGWAVRAADMEAGRAELVIVGRSAAGQGWSGQLEAGQAVRISTGAPLPAGADRIIIQEEAERNGDRVRLGPLGAAGTYIRPRGGDFQKGETLLTVGCRLDPWRIALAAAAGCAQLSVSRCPNIVIAATGNEIAAPGANPGRWQIHDSAGAGLAAWFRARGCGVMRLAPLADDREAISTALAEAACDLIITIGGASVGDHDLVKPAFRKLGCKLIVDGVAVRPGKPAWFGVLPDGRLVLGLPGNLVSAMVCAELFATNLISALEGMPSKGPKMQRARLLAQLPANGPREHFMRARLQSGKDGGLKVEAADNQDSSLVSVLAGADALIRRLPGAPAAQVGEAVDIMQLARF